MNKFVEKSIDHIDKKGYPTKTWMYLCGIIGIVSMAFGILALYFQLWIAAGILFLITVRQAIVFPKWRKIIKLEKEAQL